MSPATNLRSRPCMTSEKESISSRLRFHYMYCWLTPRVTSRKGLLKTPMINGPRCTEHSQCDGGPRLPVWCTHRLEIQSLIVCVFNCLYGQPIVPIVKASTVIEDRKKQVNLLFSLKQFRSYYSNRDSHYSYLFVFAASSSPARTSRRTRSDTLGAFSNGRSNSWIWSATAGCTEVAIKAAT